MKLNQYTKIFSNRVIITIVGLILLFCNAGFVNAQSAPSIQRHMIFGTFLNNLSEGATGNISISSDDMSTLTSDPGIIMEAGSSHQSACIRVNFKKNDGDHAVTITYGPPVNLSNGTKTILFTPCASNKYYDIDWNKSNSSFVDIYIGGTLTIGSPSVNPSGYYSGTFKVFYTYNQN